MIFLFDNPFYYNVLYNIVIKPKKALSVVFNTHNLVYDYILQTMFLRYDVNSGIIKHKVSLA